MVRASSIYRICSKRPYFDKEEYDGVYNELVAKVEAKKLVFNILLLETYINTSGLITIAKAFKAQSVKRELFNEDPLPDGAITYLQELWLQSNIGLHDFSLKDAAFQIQKGKICETEAIAIIGGVYGITLQKNEKRKTFAFLSGECDMDTETSVRDCKVSETWKTFRVIDKIASVYYWQLIAYCYLYGKQEAYLDYVLMPTPQELKTKFTRDFSEEEWERFMETETAIKNLPLNRRVKTYELPFTKIPEDIKFMLSRLAKAEEYYNTLTYEICMKLI